MSDQDNDSAADQQIAESVPGGRHEIDDAYASGATSTAGHGSTEGNEGNVGRTGYNNSTSGRSGNKGAHNTSVTGGAATTERYDELTEGDQYSSTSSSARGGVASYDDGPATDRGIGIAPEIVDGADTGSSPVGDPGAAARGAYSGHGTYSGGGSNDPNAQETPDDEPRGVGPGTFAADDSADTMSGNPKGGTTEAKEDIGAGRYGGDAGGKEDTTIDPTSSYTDEHDLSDSAADAQTSSDE